VSPAATPRALERDADPAGGNARRRYAGATSDDDGCHRRHRGCRALALAHMQPSQHETRQRRPRAQRPAGRNGGGETPR